VQLGALAVVRGRLEEARPSLEEGLNLSLATHSTRNLTLSLAAFAQLAFKEGNAERAALLAGAVEGLRRRVGLRAWPMLLPGEAELVARVREALGPTGSARCSPPAPGSADSRRWSPSGTGAASAPGRPEPWLRRGRCIARKLPNHDRARRVLALGLCSGLWCWAGAGLTISRLLVWLCTLPMGKRADCSLSRRPRSLLPIWI
jgi:hypothetical protein